MTRAKAVSASAAGFLAILLWSGSISFQRRVSECVGPLVTGAGACLIGGALGCVVLLLRPSMRRGLRGAWRKETLVCGVFFVIFEVCYVTSVGLATDRKQALAVGVINYLWPAITLVLSIPILGSRPRPWLPAGIVVAVAGAGLAAVTQGDLTWADVLAALRANAWAYLITLLNAVAWAFYSNYTRRWVRQVPGGIVFLYVLATGVVMAAAAGAVALAGPASAGGAPDAAPPFTAEILLYLLAQALGPTLLAYIFWETAMRFGSVTLVNSAAYLTPVFSLIASCIVFQQPAGWGLWVGSALVVAGAVVCRLSIREAHAPPA